MEPLLASRALHLVEAPHPDSSDAISLDSGYGFADIFPDLTAAAQRALTTYRGESLQYGKPFGLLALREWISRYLAEDGIALAPDEILIVNGAKNGIDLLCRLFTEDGDTIAISAPTYFTAIPIFKSFGLQFVQVPQDSDGMDVAALERALAQRSSAGLPAPKFIYEIPDFHNPTGVTLSRERREKLVALASRLRIPILEDSPYRKLRYDGEQAPALKALDDDGIVFSLGTFSKLMAPGLRVGWIGGTRPMLERVARLKSDGGTCPFTQRVIFEFCNGGGLDAQSVRARETYAAHRDTMVAAVRRELPEFEFAVPEGGYYLWATLPRGTDSKALAARAYDAGVSIIAGAMFYADPADAAVAQEAARHIRLSYSGSSPAEIEEGVRRLARAYRTT
ncbi:MAG: PLP-dependent aminotransferase family protein [Candidatus Tyrphobacter sp.]